LSSVVLGDPYAQVVILRMRSEVCSLHNGINGIFPNNTEQFCDPELPINYTTFMALRWRVRVVYIGESPC